MLHLKVIVIQLGITALHGDSSTAILCSFYATYGMSLRTQRAWDGPGWCGIFSIY